MHYMTNHEHGAFDVCSSYDGRSVIVVLNSFPVTIQLNKLAPADARKFGLLLISQAEKCDAIAADSARLETINAMRLDEVTA